MKNPFIYAVMLSLVLLGGSCKKNNDAVTPADCGNLSKRLDALVLSATTYGNNPTKANCEAYKKAANEYISSASGCPGVSAKDIADARADVNSTVCQ